MAKLQLIIDADDADDLTITLAALLSALGGEADEGAAPSATPPRRGRPRKPADAAPVTTTSGAPETTVAGAEAGPTVTTAASPSEPAPGGLDKSAMTAIMSDAIDKIGAMAAAAALTELGMPAQLSKLTPDQYEAAHAALSKAIAMG